MKRLTLILASLASCAVQAEGPGTVLGTWRITHAQPAPWVGDDDPKPDTTSLLGETITYATDRVEGPSVIGCANPRYEYAQRPLDSLFQGNLPAPVENSAGSVGLAKAPVRSVDITCDTGVWDLHFATSDALLLGFDNAVWFLDRSPGASAKAGTPEHTVQALLEEHYAAGLGFDEQRTRAQKKFFTAALAKRIDAYFAQHFPEDEVPPIDGDVITDSQDYPPLFSVREAQAAGDAMQVPVRYDDGYETRLVNFTLRRERGEWRVDDIDYAHGTSFTALLARKPGK